MWSMNSPLITLQIRAILLIFFPVISQTFHGPVPVKEREREREREREHLLKYIRNKVL